MRFIAKIHVLICLQEHFKGSDLRLHGLKCEHYYIVVLFIWQLSHPLLMGGRSLADPMAPRTRVLQVCVCVCVYVCTCVGAEQQQQWQTCNKFCLTVKIYTLTDAIPESSWSWSQDSAVHHQEMATNVSKRATGEASRPLDEGHGRYIHVLGVRKSSFSCL